MELGVSRRRVQAMIHAGRLAALRPGNEYLVEPGALDKVRDRRPGRPPSAGPKKRRKNAG